MATAEQFVQKCLAEKGDEYEMGGEYAPGTPPSRTEEWDCSGIVKTKLEELGVDAPRVSTEQLRWCERQGTLIPLGEGVETRGALLLREGHVAVSLGDGTTIEALGEKWGVGIFSATRSRTFTHAALVPGLDYGDVTTKPYCPHPRGSTGRGGDTSRESRPTVRRGSRGDDVTYLQKRLDKLGFDPKGTDGIFGADTESAVKAFQRDRGLDVDGVVGPGTWAALRPKKKKKTTKKRTNAKRQKSRSA